MANNEQETEHRINFLNNAISDAQALIQFTDTKTAIAITILGSYIIGLFLAADNVLTYWEYFSGVFCLLLSGLIVSIAVCILVIKRIIRPTNNPVDNIELGTAQAPTPSFYIAPNDNVTWYPFANSKKSKLKKTYTAYLGEIKAATGESIIESLSFELLKVSFIRNIKNDRFNFLVKCLAVCTVLFIATYGFYSVETQKTKTIVEIKEKSKLKIDELRKQTLKYAEELKTKKK